MHCDTGGKRHRRVAPGRPDGSCARAPTARKNRHCGRGRLRHGQPHCGHRRPGYAWRGAATGLHRGFRSHPPTRHHGNRIRAPNRPHARSWFSSAGRTLTRQQHFAPARALPGRSCWEGDGVVRQICGANRFCRLRDFKQAFQRHKVENRNRNRIDFSFQLSALNVAFRSHRPSQKSHSAFMSTQ